MWDAAAARHAPYICRLCYGRMWCSMACVKADVHEHSAVRPCAGLWLLRPASWLMLMLVLAARCS
jgi:hypothetical protein